MKFYPNHGFVPLNFFGSARGETNTANLIKQIFINILKG
jgi:hypothetical protein